MVFMKQEYSPTRGLAVAFLFCHPVTVSKPPQTWMGNITCSHKKEVFSIQFISSGHGTFPFSYQLRILREPVLSDGDSKCLAFLEYEEMYTFISLSAILTK